MLGDLLGVLAQLGAEAAVLLFSFRSFGLTGLLVAATAPGLFRDLLASLRFPGELFVPLLLTAASLAALACVGVVASRRPEREDEARVDAPEFVKRLEAERRVKYEMDLLSRMQLALLPDASVDVVITSPPYNLGVNYRSYDDARPREEYLGWVRQWAAEVARVLRPHGSFFLNVGSMPREPWAAMDVAQAVRPGRVHCRPRPPKPRSRSTTPPDEVGAAPLKARNCVTRRSPA